MVDAGCSRSGRLSSSKSYLDLVSPLEKYQDLKSLHHKHCKKYFCLCRKHVVSVICVNETRKLYWFNSRSVDEKISQGLGEGYYNKLLRIVNGALNNWAQRYINGLGENFKTIMLKINGSARGNMKLLKEGCYCHYHPHITADVCNADFLRRVVSRDNEAGIDENDDLDALTPGWMVFMLLLLPPLHSFARLRPPQPPSPLRHYFSMFSSFFFLPLFFLLFDAAPFLFSLFAH